jgi:hypothetical protein
MIAMASVPSRKGAPMIAPMAISCCSIEPPMTIAITGMTDSGSAVATAASRLPTAPWARPSRTPAHSTALVKKNAPTTIRTKETARRT